MHSSVELQITDPDELQWAIVTVCMCVCVCCQWKVVQLIIWLVMSVR